MKIDFNRARARPRARARLGVAADFVTPIRCAFPFRASSEVESQSRARARGRLRDVFWKVVCVLSFALITSSGAETTLKVGFIYVGPISDFGWTRSHDYGRSQAQKVLPWVETSYVESVSEGELESYIDQMADQGVKVIFTTSTSYVDGTIAAAASHPDILFFNASGFKNAPNVATYTADLYQINYLFGLLAGGLTKSGKIGYVATFPTPESVRYINALALGARAVNPSAMVIIRWLNTWYNPPAEKEAAEALLSQGADFLMNGADSPTVAQVATAHHVPVNGHAAILDDDVPYEVISRDAYNWGPTYIRLLQGVRDGKYTSQNLQNMRDWYRLAEGAVQFAYKPGIPIDPKYKDALSASQVSDGLGGKISVYDLVLKRLAQMSASPPQFEPFKGPIKDADGKIRIPEGRAATKEELFGMTWRVAGVVGNWPLKTP
jgi:basic membrane protein A and related proteins